MDEQFVPGDYTALGAMNIRVQMKTMPDSNIVGGYRNGATFRVYEVYSEVSGIVWGRVSSNTGEGQARYVGLRVNNQPKAKLEMAFVEGGAENGDALITVLTRIAVAIEGLSKK